MPLRFKKRLLTHLRHEAYRPSSIDQLADDLRIPEGDRDLFAQAVEQMRNAGDVVVGAADIVRLPPMGKEVIGQFRGTSKGFGFIIPEDVTRHGDLFVPPHSVGEAITGDRVRAEVQELRNPKPGHSPYVGVVVEILERRHSNFTGTIAHEDGHWWVEPDGKVLNDSFVVQDAESKNVKVGVKVVFEIVSMPEDGYAGEAVIVKVLGEAGLPSIETQAVIEAHNLPGDFPEKARAEARGLTKAFDALVDNTLANGGSFPETERLDLRNRLICTIDPPDAKDYDDAISIERTKRGWKLGVHIADVANFVTPGTALDDEAKDRGNSVYLPRLVIPMLPEILSNGICSLQEGVERFCKSAFIEYDEDGNVVAQGFAATLIKSAKRMTYLEAQAIIDNDLEEAKKHARTDTEVTNEIIDALKMMNTLSRRIRERRRRNGMIHLDLPEVELVFDQDGHVTDAVPEDDAYTHTLIEMFMVEANEAVARLFEDLHVPIIRRVHPDPVPGQGEQLSDFVRVAGYRIPKTPTRADLQQLLDATKGSPAAPAVHMAVLRTLTKAEYSPALIGHFALASTGYAHFTSPIRRYADLTVHRALTAYLGKTNNGKNSPKDDGAKYKLGRELKDDDACPDEPTLTQIAGNCNRTEMRATDAERELRQFLVLQLLEEHIGESFAGIVTGVSPAGVFVQLQKYLAEGLCKTQDLPVSDNATQANKRRGLHERALWRIDRRSGALVEKNTGRSFSIGDRVEVTVASVDLARRQMELVVTTAAMRDTGKAKRIAERVTAGAPDDPTGLGLTFGDVVERTGAQRRSQKSKSRDKRKGDHRKDRKDKGKRQ